MNLEIKLPENVKAAFSLLNEAGFEAYLVGGAVRDCVRDEIFGTKGVKAQEAHDWDMTTNATPNEMKKVFSAYRLIETGLKHGTVTVIIEKEPIEITTYRVDGEYTDHRHPDSVKFTTSLKEDLKRRDFTMNSLVYSPNEGFIDFFGGVEDIKSGTVRCVGEAKRRFNEDALRILRALRFSSVFNMKVESETSQAAFSERFLLNNVAAERIEDELSKLLCGSGAGRVLKDYAEIIAVPLYEISPMFGFEQHNPHHDKDVWNHTVAVVENISPKRALRWAALLHDVGKPYCFEMASDGIGHFYSHVKISVEMAQEILLRLHFDNATKDKIITLIRYHDLPITADKKLLKRLLRKLGEENTKELIDLHKADCMGQAQICKERIDEYNRAFKVLDEILSEDACFSLKDLKINGHDMLSLGFVGEEIGKALNECLNAVIEEKVLNEREALFEYAKMVGKQS